MKTGLLMLFFITLLVVSYRMIDDLNATNTHPQNTSCNDCHLARGKIDQTNAKTLVASQEELCKPCHLNALTANHPTGIKPINVPPQIFPLDWKGDLTCSTCHSLHNNEPGLLRVKRHGKELCQSCHDEKFFLNMKDGGSSVMSFGHLDARASLVGDIDSFSIQCMSCHDSLTGSLNVRLSGEVIRHNSNRVNHPIGMRYADSLSYGGYRPIAMLAGEIVLPDGKVSCISCHQGYSDKHGKLVMDNRGDGLCLSCHDI